MLRNTNIITRRLASLHLVRKKPRVEVVGVIMALDDVRNAADSGWADARQKYSVVVRRIILLSCRLG